METARARNEGTFFKGLFKADVLQQSAWTKDGEAGGSGRGDPATGPHVAVHALEPWTLHCVVA